MGSLTGATQSQSENKTTTSDPWAPQQPYITQGFGLADYYANKRLNSGPFQGPLYSGMSPQQLDLANQYSGYAQGPLSALMQGTQGTAGALQWGASPFLDNASWLASSNPMATSDPAFLSSLQGAQDLATRPLAAVPTSLSNMITNSVGRDAAFGSNPYAAIPPALMGALGNAAGSDANLAANPTARAPQPLVDALTSAATGQGGLSGQLNSNAMQSAQGMSATQSSLLDALQRAQNNPTQQTIQNATQFAQNPYTQGAINSTNALIDQTLNEQTLPGINRTAAMGGDLNSSRAGAANAQAQEGAALAKGSADSSILNNAWNTGVSTAANQWATGLGQQISGSSLGYNDFGNNANTTAARQASAASQGLNDTLGYQNSIANQILGANSGAASAASSGIGANLNASGLGIGANAGAMSGANSDIGNFLSAQNSAAQQRLAGNSQLGSLSLGGSNSALQQLLGANAQLGQGVSAGLIGATDAGQLANSNYNLGSLASALPWQNMNAQDQAALQQWQLKNQYGPSVIDQYMREIGGNYGGTQNTTGTIDTTSNNSPLGTLLGAGLGVGSLFAQGGALSGSGLFGGASSAVPQYGGLYGAPSTDPFQFFQR